MKWQMPAWAGFHAWADANPWPVRLAPQGQALCHEMDLTDDCKADSQKCGPTQSQEAQHFSTTSTVVHSRLLQDINRPHKDT